MTARHSMTRLGTARGAGRGGREDAGRPAPRWPAVILRVVGSGLLIATAAIHLDLYLTGYQTIPTIGWLFLLQVIAAFGLGLAVLAIPSRLVTRRLAAGPGRLRPGYPRRLPAVGLDRAVRVHGGPHGRRHRRRRALARSACLPVREPPPGGTSPGTSWARPGPAKENHQWPHRTCRTAHANWRDDAACATPIRTRRRLLKRKEPGFPAALELAVDLVRQELQDLGFFPRPS